MQEEACCAEDPQHRHWKWSNHWWCLVEDTAQKWDLLNLHYLWKGLPSYNRWTSPRRGWFCSRKRWRKRVGWSRNRAWNALERKMGYVFVMANALSQQGMHYNSCEFDSFFKKKLESQANSQTWWRTKSAFATWPLKYRSIKNVVYIFCSFTSGSTSCTSKSCLKKCQPLKSIVYVRPGV